MLKQYFKYQSAKTHGFLVSNLLSQECQNQSLLLDWNPEWGWPQLGPHCWLLMSWHVWSSAVEDSWTVWGQIPCEVSPVGGTAVGTRLPGVLDSADHRDDERRWHWHCQRGALGAMMWEGWVLSHGWCWVRWPDSDLEVTVPGWRTLEPAHSECWVTGTWTADCAYSKAQSQLEAHCYAIKDTAQKIFTLKRLIKYWTK